MGETVPRVPADFGRVTPTLKLPALALALPLPVHPTLVSKELVRGKNLSIWVAMST